MDKYLGKRLDGRYEMRELIGVGGMAYVYKAYDAVDDRVVAVKILKDEFLNSDEFVRRFRNESKAIAILNHPNIVKVLDVGFGERLQYIVMEYIDGITLKEYLDQRKDIRWKEAVHFTVQILRALQHAHDKGIVHRDIKPQNIMLLSDGTIKVTDFGIARLTRSDMKATVDGNKAIGSVHYISPEQARGEITDEKTDLYAVGIMLYETLTGCLPFEADNAVSVAIMQMQSEAKAPHLINPDIPEGLEQITLKAMQKDTAKRYQSAAEMLSDFEEFKRNPSIKFEYTYMVDDTPTRFVDAITRVRGEEPEQTSKTAKKENGDAPKKKAANKNTTKTVSLIVILCLVTALTIGAVVWLVAWLINGGGRKAVDEVEVKNFIGMMYYTEIDGVAEYNEDYDLKIVWEDANNSDRKVGEVFKQSPKKGKKVKKGSTVTLYVNNATPKEISLDVKAEIEGVHKDEVHSLLQAAGFEVQEDPRSSDLIPADHVIQIDIEKGKSYPHGKVVTMTVSTGVSKLPDIPFPDLIIGQPKKTAEEILKNNKFEGDIIYVESNYTDEQFSEKGIVMGVMIDHVLLEELPEKISPDAALTLVVSNGCKDVVVELEWPQDINGKNVDVTLGVTTWVAGTLNNDLAKHYEMGKKPSAITDKMTFTLTDHPSDKPYTFEVGIKKYASSEEAVVYAKVQIQPTTGTWTLVGDYYHLPGISPEAVIPNNLVGQSLTFKNITDKLNGFKTVTLMQDENVLTQDNGQTWAVDEILYNGETVDGDKIKFGVALPANAEITVKVRIATTAVIPNNFLGKTMSYTDIRNKLSGFNKVTIQLGAETLNRDDGRALKVDEILYGGQKVDGNKIKFDVSLAANVEVVVKVSTVSTAQIPNIIGGVYTYTDITDRLEGFQNVVVRLGSQSLTEDDGRALQVDSIYYNGQNVDGVNITFNTNVYADAEIIVNVSVITTDIPFPGEVFEQTSRMDIESLFTQLEVELTIQCNTLVMGTDILSVTKVQYTTESGDTVTIYADNIPATMPKNSQVVVFVDVMVYVPYSYVWQDGDLADFDVVFVGEYGDEITDPNGLVIIDIQNEDGISVSGEMVPKGSTLFVILEDI